MLRVPPAAAATTGPVTILRSMEHRDGGGDSDPSFRLPPEPDDRLWRHPSELPPLLAARRSSDRSVRVVAVVSCTVGALVAIVLVSAASELRGSQHETRPAVAGAGVEPGAPVLGVAQEAKAAVVQIDVRRPGGRARGLGVVLRGDGYVLTDAEVVEGIDAAAPVTVELADHRRLPGTVVGTDRETNVAVVKIVTRALHPARMGTAADLSPGQTAIAVETAAGRRPWATVCTVSVLHTWVQARGESGPLRDLIQTDVEVGPASSGGALLDRTGALVGILTTSGHANAGRHEGLATPIDVARQVAEQLMADGKVARPWLGVEGTDLDAPGAAALRVAGGAVVGKVVDGGPAQRSGMAARDVVVAIDGRDVPGMRALAALLRAHRPGDTVSVDVVRGSNRQAMRVTLAERPPRP